MKLTKPSSMICFLAGLLIEASFILLIICSDMLLPYRAYNNSEHGDDIIALRVVSFSIVFSALVVAGGRVIVSPPSNCPLFILGINLFIKLMLSYAVIVSSKVKVWLFKFSYNIAFEGLGTPNTSNFSIVNFVDVSALLAPISL